MSDLRLGTVSALYRYPVKSLVGESLDHAEVTERGFAGDRLWAVTDPDGKIGSGKSTRRFRRMRGLLELTAQDAGGQAPVVTFPDGRRFAAGSPELDTALTGHVGRPVRLRRETTVSHFDDGPVHLVTSASLRALSEARGAQVSAERLRPNLVIAVPDEGTVEQQWLGSRIRVGGVVLRVREPMPRCVMVDLPQRGLPADGSILPSIARLDADLGLGVVADVLSPGSVAVGDTVTA